MAVVELGTNTNYCKNNTPTMRRVDSGTNTNRIAITTPEQPVEGGEWHKHQPLQQTTLVTGGGWRRV